MLIVMIFKGVTQMLFKHLWVRNQWGFWISKFECHFCEMKKVRCKGLHILLFHLYEVPEKNKS